MPDRLKRLNDLLHTAEKKADETKKTASDADNLVRDLRAEIAAEKKSRRHLRGLSLVPAAVWAAHQLRRHAAVAASTAALIVGLGIGMHIGPDQPSPTPTPTIALPPPATAAPTTAASPTDTQASPTGRPGEVLSMPVPMLEPTTPAAEPTSSAPSPSPTPSATEPFTMPPVGTPPPRHSGCVVILHLSAIQIRVLCGAGVT